MFTLLACPESTPFTVINVQMGYPALLTCNLGDTKTDEYSWIEFSTQNRILYKNNSLITGFYSYAPFDNSTFAFLYVFTTNRSTFACVRNSDNTFLNIYTVMQCPESKTFFLNLHYFHFI